MSIRSINKAQLELSAILDTMGEVDKRLIMAWLRKYVHSGFVVHQISQEAYESGDSKTIIDSVRQSMATRIGQMVLDISPMTTHFVDGKDYRWDQGVCVPHYVIRSDFTIIGEKNGIKG